MSSRLPLFPLRLILFPGELVPLHIFEPRYRQLLADCLAGDQRFGLTPHIPPGPGAIGCAARILSTEPLEDGRSNIVILGERRFRVRALLEEDRLYSVGSVEEFSDEGETGPLPAELDELRHLGGELRLALGVLADRVGEEPSWSEDAELLSFQIASMADLDFDAKKRLLESRSTRERARALVSLLPSLVTQMHGRAQVHIRARGNGTGHHGSDLVFGS